MKTTIRTLCGIAALVLVTFGFIYGPTEVSKSRSDNIWLLSLLGAGILLLGAFWIGRAPISRDASQDDRLRHNVQRISSLLVVGFLLLGLQLLRDQVVVATEIQKPYLTPQDEIVQDPRVIREQLSNQRGLIRDTFGNIVAGREVNPKTGLVKRTYTNPPVDQLIGYFSPLQFGNSGLEEVYDDYLTGKSGINPLVNWQRKLLHEPTVGNDIYLTIDPNLQAKAVASLGNLPGSIVLLDARTGAVLVMAGNPNFDPSGLAFDPTTDDTEWPKQSQNIQKRWQELNKDPAKPLLLRPTQGLYTPGSVFKTVTLAAALDLGLIQPNTEWIDNGSFKIDSAPAINDPNRPTPNTTWTTQQGYMFSLNAVFAQIGLKVGGDNLIRYSHNFGFGQTVPFDLPVAKSSAFSQAGFLTTPIAIASTGFGQGELQATPLEMALIAASIGRGDGTLPKPYLVKEIKTPEGVLIKQTQPEVWLRPIRPETSRAVKDIMIASATDGWVGRNGGGLKDSGAVVGGKTGTAEVGEGVQNAWYIAWASKGDRTFAIAVIIDHQAGGEGLKLALPRANELLRAALATVK